MLFSSAAAAATPILPLEEEEEEEREGAEAGVEEEEGAEAEVVVDFLAARVDWSMRNISVCVLVWVIALFNNRDSIQSYNCVAYICV